MTSKCSVTVLGVGVGGLSTKSTCGRPATQRFGKRGYCSEHAGAERRRLRLDELEAGARAVVAPDARRLEISLGARSGTRIAPRRLPPAARPGPAAPRRRCAVSDFGLGGTTWRLRGAARSPPATSPLTSSAAENITEQELVCNFCGARRAFYAWGAPHKPEIHRSMRSATSQ